jgi:DNA ligase 1
MKFCELALYLEKLEGTSSRLSMTEILAELFSKVDASEGKIVAYMVSGMLGPKYNNPDSGMAGKQVIKAIKLLSNGDVEKIFKEVGDLGKTVERLQTKTSSSLQVVDVYQRLLEIAESSGTGSQDKKQELLVGLIKELDGVSAKYAVKMILGKMRGGFSDMTVLDSLSWMKTGNKSLREDIEKIYNVRADLGEVVKLVKENDDISGLRVDPEAGTPILVARAERAKSTEEIWGRVGPEAACEHKLDGLRIQAHVMKGKVMLFSRGMENVTAMYPDIVEGLRKQVGVECILDGEMIAVDRDGKYLPFQETVQRKRKYGILEMVAEVPLKYYTFDVLSAGGKSFLDEPNEVRWKKLTGLINGGETVKLMPRKIVKSGKEIEEFFFESLGEGTEGVVVKKLDGIYRSGSRDFNWIKYKKSYDESSLSDTVDAVVMGYDVGQGKRAAFGIGDFLIGVYEPKDDRYYTIAKIGTGLTDEEWKQLNVKCKMYNVKSKPENYEVTRQMECDYWVKPEIVVEVKADEITRSPMHSTGYALRFPRLISWREKKPEDATSVSEIKRLFEMQKRED